MSGSREHAAEGASAPGRRSEAAALGIVFFSNAIVMILEIAAGRLVAPALGTSLYTWTSVLGVVLAGLAVGNLVGGRLAERHPPEFLLGPLFGIAAGMCVLVIASSTFLGAALFLDSLPWIPRVLLHVTLVFLPPAVALGAVSPVASRMAIAGSVRPGETLGRLFAAAATGSIAGTFLAGYVLLSAFGVKTVIWTLAGLLALASIPWRDAWSRRGGSAATWLLLCFLANDAGALASSYGTALFLREEPDPLVLYRDEGPYSIIEVRRDAADPSLRRLVLDKLVHSQVRPAKLDEPIYDYVRTCAALLDVQTPESDRVHEGPDGSYLVSPSPYRSLVIGGGGYSLPHHLVARFPAGHVDVVEIDPRVTAASHAALGLADPPPFTIAHADGRVFLNAAARNGPTYDFVFVDAVQDFAVPPQLVTVEFFEQARAVLKPGGTLYLNLIAQPLHGKFLARVYKTARRIFPEVDAFTWGRRDRVDTGMRQTYILRASLEPKPMPEAPTYVAHGAARRVPNALIADLLAHADGPALTDDFAPVEALIGESVRGAASELGLARRLARANEWLLIGELERAEAVAKAVLAVTPDQPEALTLLGVVALARGNAEGAEGILRDAIRRSPGNAIAQHNLANILAESGRLAEARRHYALAIQADPDFALPNIGLAEVLAREGRDTDAVLVLGRALLADPGRVDALFRMGELASRIGDLEMASRSYASVLRRDPGHVQAMNNLGGILGRIGRWEQAESLLEQAVQRQPGFAEARFNLALVRIGQRRNAEARVLLERLRADHPDHPGLPEALRRARG